ncbi:rhodanese-like domain-containing protein [Rossellomorea aquimaris]|uniref:rhodanese-like domain-containing protein n=1 Tax=Rossellomorea aquimaris TaxID=189382 RepID=UPI001CD1EE36|nr:rhodanese-like domain-containing protein [Rossellomorea aquimaris]MCA1053902.1 rhodanese-like domain-containing protein [Rossellomorea aquimaris]
MEIIGLLILALLVFLYVRNMKPGKEINQMTTTDLKKHLGDRSKQFIDVRTPMEFRARNIKSFRNIPLNELQKNIGKLSKEKETIVICQSGMRSSKACKILSSSGFKNISNVKGGMNAWSN